MRPQGGEQPRAGFCDIKEDIVKGLNSGGDTLTALKRFF